MEGIDYSEIDDFVNRVYDLRDELQSLFGVAEKAENSGVFPTNMVDSMAAACNAWDEMLHYLSK